jgi:transposase
MQSIFSAAARRAEGQQLKTLPGKAAETKAEEPEEAAKAKRKNRQKPKPKKARGNAPEFGLDAELQRITGVNVARVDGIDVMTIQTVISEVGVDMSPWKTERHFTSWLGLCPYQDISGGKVLKTGTRRVKNRAACAFRLAAATLRRSQSYLGAQFRRFRARLGPAKAITAMARKLAVIFYKMMKFGQEYVDQGAEFYEEKYRQHEFRLLIRTASRLGAEIQFPAKPA